MQVMLLSILVDLSAASLQKSPQEIFGECQRQLFTCKESCQDIVCETYFKGCIKVCRVVWWECVNVLFEKGTR